MSCKRHRKEPVKKHQQRMRHVITRDASPYFAFSLKKFPVSYKARYVNDVHLPRFDRLLHLTFCNRRSDLVLQLLFDFTNRFYTEQPPASKMPHGDSKDFSPSNAWNDSKTAVLRQLSQPPKLARGVGHSAPVLLMRIRLMPSQISEHPHAAFP